MYDDDDDDDDDDGIEDGVIIGLRKVISRASPMYVTQRARATYSDLSAKTANRRRGSVFVNIT